MKRQGEASKSWLQRLNPVASTPGNIRRFRFIMFTVVMLVGVGVSWVVFELVRFENQAENRLRFEQEATQMSADLQTRFNLSLEYLLAIPPFFSASTEVTRHEFSNFVSRALERHPSIYTFEFLPRVLHANRADFEKMARNEGLEDFVIRAVDATGKDVPLITKSAYFPIFYGEPPIPGVFGVDLAAHPEQGTYVDKACAVENPVATPPLSLIEDPDDVLSVIAFTGVRYASTQSSDVCDGIAMIVIRMRPVLEGALGQTRLDEFLLALINPDAADAQQLIYKNYPGTAERVSRPDWPFAEHDIHFADQTWNLTLAPAEGSSLAPESPPYWIFGAGLLFSLFAAYSISASIAIGGLRKQVEARSEALKAMRLGQYTLVEKIGEGGVGVVYKAEHAMLRRPTAVKMLRPGKVTDEDIARFEREVQATSQLAHPNTVEIYDYGRTPEGVFYYAMEYLEGLTLAGLIELEGAVPASRVIHILKQVCGSLSEAHAAGLIHRDIKPLNIFLCERGGIADMVKVLDFGLVKNIVSSGMTELTSADVIGGTPGYIAPERLRDPLHIDARADIYSLGCVAFNLLTGQPLFTGVTVMEICHQTLTESPARPSERVEDKGTIPLELDDLVVACLARDPDARPRDIEALLDTLNAIAEGSRWSQEEARTWWRRNRDTQIESRREEVSLEEAKRAEATTVTLEIKPRG